MLFIRPYNALPLLVTHHVPSALSWWFADFSLMWIDSDSRQSGKKKT